MKRNESETGKEENTRQKKKSLALLANDIPVQPVSLSLIARSTRRLINVLMLLVTACCAAALRRP